MLLCNRSHGGVLSLKDCTVTNTLQSIIHLKDIRPDVELMCGSIVMGFRAAEVLSNTHTHIHTHTQTHAHTLTNIDL